MDQATLTLVADDPALPTTVPLAATAESPTVEADLTSIALGGIDVGASSPPAPFTISNTGNAPLLVYVVAVEGASAGRFALLPPPKLPWMVPPGGSVTTSVVYTPMTGAGDSGDVRLAVDDPNTPEILIALAGHGRAPAIHVTPPNAIDFGSSLLGVAKSKTVTIDNMGDAVLTLSRLDVVGAGAAAFSVDTQAPVTLDPQHSLTLNVSFLGSFAGTVQATLDIESPDPGVGAVNLLLTATGLAAGLGYTPMELDFGPIVIGQTSLPRTMTLHNGGTLPIAIDHIVSTDLQFLVDASAITGPLALGASASYTVSFAPSSEGDVQGQSVEVFLAGAALPTVTVPLSGSGVPDRTKLPSTNGCSMGAMNERRPVGTASGLFVLGVLLAAAGVVRRRR